MKLRYFNTSEFDCPIAGQGDKMDKNFLELLDEARHIADVPFRNNERLQMP